MAIREELVGSAVTFLQDSNVISSPLANKIAFLRAKNLTQEEIDTALARVGISTSAPTAPSQAVSAQVQQPPSYGQYQTPPYGWQPAPPPPLRRDWRDWFIMATVMGGIGYSLYSITKRYIYPLVAPPTPDRLEQDKALVDEQFEKAFATIEQLAKDTEALKASEQERTQKLDQVLTDLDNFMRDTRSASRRQEDDTDRLRDEMKVLKDLIPRNMAAHKESTDGRLREIASEVQSLKSLIGQRMSSSSPPAPVRRGNAQPTTPGPVPTAPSQDAEATEDGAVSGPANGEPHAQARQDYLSSVGGRSSPFGTGMPSGRASIPAWQMAARNENSVTSGTSDGVNGSQQAARDP